MTEKIRKRKYIIVFTLSSLSFLLILGEQLLSLYRYERLGLDPKIAGHNFTYNFTYFFPAIFISIILSVVALVIYARTLDKLKKENAKINWFERLSVLPALVPFLSILYFIIFVIYSIIKIMSAA